MIHCFLKPYYSNLYHTPLKTKVLSTPLDYGLEGFIQSNRHASYCKAYQGGSFLFRMIIDSEGIDKVVV